MAKADLEVPFSGIHGKISKDSDIYYTNRYGKTVVSNYPRHKDPKKITTAQHAQQATFREAVAQATAILQDPGQRAYWSERFAHQPTTGKQYKVLQNFIIAQLMKDNE